MKKQRITNKQVAERRSLDRLINAGVKRYIIGLASSAGIFALAAAIVLNIGGGFNLNRGAYAADTGAATLTGVKITQAGTGLSGETNNRVLINNVVKWSATYQATTLGQVTLSATLPANNTFDQATVAASAGCATGSALSKGAGSQTNNVATCIKSADAQNFSWDLSAQVWGANGATIKPSFAVSGITQNVQPAAITLLGTRHDYQMQTYQLSTTPAANGWNPVPILGFALYAPLDANGILGLEPLKNGSYTFTIDMSGMPAGWQRTGCSNYTQTNVLPAANGGGTNAMVYSGISSCVDNSDSVTVTVNGAATAVASYPTVRGDNNASVSGRAYYSGASIYFKVPVDQLSATTTNYTASFSHVTAETDGGEVVDITPNAASQTYALNNLATANPYVWPHTPTGWQNYYSGGQPFYLGETFNAGLVLQSNTVPTSDHATNLNYCATWNATQMNATAAPIFNTNATSGLGSNYGSWHYEFGVLAANNSTPVSGGCGVYGDGAANFFANLTEAQNYATANNGQVNAIRIYVATPRAGQRDMFMFDLPMKVSNNATIGFQPTFSAYATADEYVGPRGPNVMTQRIVGGIARASMSATNTTDTSPSIPVGGTENIKITPYTYGQDTNVKIAVNVPVGLTPVAGSYKMNGQALTPDVVTNADGSIALTFSLGVLGAAGNNNTAQSPLTFDVNVSTDLKMPQTLKINASITGDGTQYTSLGFRGASATVPVAAAASFGYTAKQSNSVVQPGDTQNYDFTLYNTTTDDVHNVSEIVVLPYNGDNNGTSGVASYKISDFAASGDSLNLYCTTDTAARTNPQSNTIIWSVCMKNTIPAAATALKWTQSTLSPDSGSLVASISLSDFVATNGAKIGASISYIYSDEFGAATNVNQLSATYQKASISGTVYRDVDLNGGFNQGDDGLSGLTVQLKQNDIVVKTATTNGDGKYAFDTLVGGNYTVSLANVPSAARPSGDDSETLLTNTDAPTEITLAAGADDVKNMGFVFLPLAQTDTWKIPAATDQTTAQPIELTVLANDSGPNGQNDQSLSISGVVAEASAVTVDDTICTDPAKGMVQVVNGKLLYTPTVLAFGDDSFCYEVQDKFRRASVARVNLELLKPDAPQIELDTDGDSATIYRGGEHTFAMKIVADSTWQAKITQPPYAGRAWIDGDTLSFDTNADDGTVAQAGEYLIEVQVTDAFGQTADASYTITVLDRPAPTPGLPNTGIFETIKQFAPTLLPVAGVLLAGLLMAAVAVLVRRQV